MDKDKYHGHVPDQTLLRPNALRVKCEPDTRRNHLKACQLLSWNGRGRRPRSCGKPWQPWRGTWTRECGYPPLPHAIGANGAKKLRGVLLEDLFWRRSSYLFRW